jgi:hypothetical protein
VANGTIEDADAVARDGASGSRLAYFRGIPVVGQLWRALRWFWCANELRDARAALVTRSAEQLELLRRARLALEVGDQVLQPVAQPRHGSAAGHAAGHFREALCWAAEVSKTNSGAGSAGQPHPWVHDACQDPEQKVALERLLAVPDPTEFFAALEPESQYRTALFLRGCAVRLLEAQERPYREVQQRLALRVVRLAVPLLVLGCVLLTAWLLAPEKPNLAAGKPWRTSSSYADCRPAQGICGGARTLILFHTKYEDNPWFEYDLGPDTRFSSLTIRNRGDGPPGRAVPLIVEVSDDGQSYREIARREHEFDVWRPSFSTQQARFLRLRVPHPTYLHLEEVKVHP